MDELKAEPTMAECRACLIKNVRMHTIKDTRYRETFEKITGNTVSH